jgi:hypothetical protein
MLGGLAVGGNLWDQQPASLRRSIGPGGPSCVRDRQETKVASNTNGPLKAREVHRHLLSCFCKVQQRVGNLEVLDLRTRDLPL